MVEQLPIPPPEHSDTFALQTEQIHLWTVRLDYATDIFYDLLSSDERVRAARYHFDVHRRRFICGRGALRRLLGAYTDSSPRDIRFRYGPNGKPALDYPGKDTLHFNLAHCDDLALVAIGHFPELGVDVERVHWLDDFDELVSRFFSARESRCFESLDLALKAPAFFNLWTRKEALLKATGDGICNSLNRVEVTFLPGEPARFLALPDNRDASAWMLHHLDPAPGYVGALAVKTANLQVNFWQFAPQEYWHEPGPDFPKGHPKISLRDIGIRAFCAPPHVRK